MNTPVQKDATPPQPPKKPVVIPPQASAADTSNWDNRAFTTPDGKVHMETFDPAKNSGIVIAE